MSERLMISVCMIVKNEEEILEKCLKSLKGFDEIVILDTGSTDKTGEIARKYTNKYFAGEYVWKDDFADARNYAQLKCKGDWIFVIDADEWVKKGTGTKAQEIVNAANGAKVFNIHVVSNNSKHTQPRLYKNDKAIFWKSPIHNYLNTQGERLVDLTVYYGYSKNHQRDPGRTLRILKKMRDKGTLGLRETFYLAREYSYKSEDSNAVYWLNEYLKKAWWLPEMSEAHLLKAKIIWKSGDRNKAREACAMALSLNPNFREAFYLMAVLATDGEDKESWKKLARGANNKNVLFVRDAIEAK